MEGRGGGGGDAVMASWLSVCWRVTKAKQSSWSWKEVSCAYQQQEVSCAYEQISAIFARPEQMRGR